MSLNLILRVGLVVTLVQGFNTPQRCLPRGRVSHLRSSLAEETSAAAKQPDTPDPLPSPPDMAAFSNGYKTVYEELSCSLSTPTFGELPHDLIGTYYKCGPAMFSAGSLPPPKNSIIQPKAPPVPDGQDMSRMVTHPFEGDGAVLAVTFHGTKTSSEDESGSVVDCAGRATMRYRYVRTNAFQNERKKGKKVYTGMESTRSAALNDAGGNIGNDLIMPFYRHHLLTGLNKMRKNTSNTRAVYFGRKLLTLWAGGLPYKLDSLALSTEGRSQLGGSIKKEENGMSSKAAIDAKANRILFFGIDEEPGKSQLNLYEFNSKFQAIQDNDGLVKVTIPGLGLMYDFAVTDNYAVFVQPALKVNGMQYMISKEPGKSISLENESSMIHIVARPGNRNAGKANTFQIPYDGNPESNIEFINSYEEEDGTIVFDAIRYISTNSGVAGINQWPWASSLGSYQSSTSKRALWRYKVHPSRGFISKDRVSNDQIYFGTINSKQSAQKHRFVYASAGSLGEEVAPPQGIIKFDFETMTQTSWFPQSHEFCGEPMYAERQGEDTEDGGYIVSTLFNGQAETSEIVVFRANDIAAGPIARVPVGIAVPHGCHGCFAPTDEANWTYEEIERRARLADKMEARGSMWNEVKSDFSSLGLRFDDIEEILGL